MDPNALLAAALDAAGRIRHRIDHSTLPIDPDVADTLVSSVEALNEWLTKGGFLPTAWTPRQGRTVLVHGTPMDGFVFIGPVTPNDPDLERMTNDHLGDTYWWYADLLPLDEALEEAEQ